MTEKPESKWDTLKEAENLLQTLRSTEASLIKIPDTVDLRLRSGFFFGAAMGIGFCIGFLLSLLILLGLISFFVYSKFPQLFS